MLLITEPFEPVVDAFAPTVGVAHYPAAVSVAHPVASLDDDGVRKLAEGIIDQAVNRLTGQ